MIATVERPAAQLAVTAGTRRRTWRWVLGSCAGFVLAVLLRQQVGWLHTEVAVLVAMCTLPGWLLLNALGIRVTWSARGIVYAVTGSLALLLIVALLAVTVLPRIGLGQPLAALPFTIALVLACLGLAAVALRPTGPGLAANWPVIADAGRHHSILAFAWPAAVPLLAAAATQLLNVTGSAIGVWLVLGLTGLLLFGALVTANTVDGQRMMPFVLYGVALTLLWSFSLRTSGLFGFDVRQEYANFTIYQDQLSWSPIAGDPYAAMLSITALPVALSQVTGISGLMLFKVVYPVLFALFPVGLYAFSRRWLGPAAALAVCSLVVLQASFPQQMSALCRQEIALLLFMGMLQASVDSDRVASVRGPLQVLTAIYGATMALSHYSTTYVAVSALIGWRVLSLFTKRRAGLGEWTVAAVIVSVVVIWYGPVTQSASNLVAAAASLVTGHSGETSASATPTAGPTSSPGQTPGTTSGASSGVSSGASSGSGVGNSSTSGPAPATSQGAGATSSTPGGSPATTSRGPVVPKPATGDDSGDANWLTSWLSSTAVTYVSAQEYADSVAEVYQREHSWLQTYPTSQLRTYQLSDDPAPTVPAAFRGAELLQPMTTLMRQLVNAASVLAVLWFALQALRRRAGPYELAAVALPFVAIAVAARVSPTLAFLYNPERLALQTSTITALPLAVLLERLLHRTAKKRPLVGRRPKPAPVARLVGLAVLGVVGLGYLDASGIGTRLMGGDPPANLSAFGEVAERLATTPADVLAAEWIGRVTPKQAVVYADRYGALQLLAYAGTGRDPVLPDITPGTLDRRAYVYATSVNVKLGRGRGATPDGTQFANYAFPVSFLDRYAAVIYDTGTARIYK